MERKEKENKIKDEKESKEREVRSTIWAGEIIQQVGLARGRHSLNSWHPI